MIRKIITGIFAAILTISIAGLAIIAWQENISSKDNREAAQLANAASAKVSADIYCGDAGASIQEEQVIQIKQYNDPEIRKLMNVDIEGLRKLNQDIIGWICIPDTDIYYPLLYGEDNEYYLRHSWNNKPSVAGAIFVEHENAADLSDFNTIIYGHNMRSGSMFGSLKEYGSQSHWRAHPHIYICNENGVFRYDIFAAYEVSTESITYAMDIKEPELRAQFIGYALDSSEIDTGIVPAEFSSILTLSTCTGDYSTRWVVQGVLNVEQSYYIDAS